MRTRKSYYELSRSQVNTPTEVVRTFWRVFGRYRTTVSSVLELGAGDCRFATGGRYKSYLGVEIDKKHAPCIALPANATMVYDCAFRFDGEGFSACVGNPPYVRHHDLEATWRDWIAKRIGEKVGHTLNRKCNLYVYFLYLALLKTSGRGIVAAVVPYDWLSRPSAAPLRKYIQDQSWSVDAFRFSESIFPGVETTACISVIDKRHLSGKWNYHVIDPQGMVTVTPRVTGSQRTLIRYSDRGSIWAMRGMSPGTQRVFTLTEGERIHAGLAKNDVYPCVTSLRDLPTNVRNLTAAAFENRFLRRGKKCWLIRSDRFRPSKRLRAYLDSIPEALRDTSTCANRNPWYRFRLAPQPDLLVSSGFVGSSPKAVVNSVGAHAIGGVHGVFGVPQGLLRSLQEYLTATDFSGRVVAYSGGFRKIEVKQLNSLLTTFSVRIST